VADFVTYYSLHGFPVVIDEDWSLRDGLGVLGAPAWVFVDDGGEATLHLGGLSATALEEMLESLVTA
jgi:hypothetical protein